MNALLRRWLLAVCDEKKRAAWLRRVLAAASPPVIGMYHLWTCECDKNSKQVRFGCARKSLKLSSGAAEPGACFIRHGRVERRGISDRSAGGLRMRARAGDSAPQKVVLGRPDEKVRRRRAHESTAVPVNQKRGKAPEPELEEPRCFSVE